MIFGPSAFPDDAIFLSRGDASNPLSAYSRHGFDLDGAFWPSVEHYFQGMKFTSSDLQRRIREAPHPRQAARIARRNFWRVRRDWKKIQVVVMTRGVYIKCRSHEEVSRTLLETDERMIVEASLYDHFWGCGRDQRGRNHFGRVLMDVRKRLRSDQPS